MATDLQSLSYVYAVLASATNPSRTGNTISPLVPPPISAGGPSLVAGSVPALVAVLDVSLAEHPWQRTARAELQTGFIPGAVLLYAQGATNASYTTTAGQTREQAVDGWVAAVNASAIPATAERVGTTLVVRQDVGTYESVDVSVTSGTATLTLTLDADAATVDVYARTRNAGSPGTSLDSVVASAWRRYVLPGASVPLSLALDRGGISMQLPIAPDVSIYPYVSAVGGLPGDGSTTTPTYIVRAYVAPCVQPGSI